MAGPATLQHTAVAAIERFDDIGLDQVRDTAELLDRCDRKYLLDAEGLDRFTDGLADRLQVLNVDGRRCFRYHSVYFDTPALDAYRDAARGRPRRWKLRVRTYVDSGESWLELKLRDRTGRTVKHRQQRPARDTAATERLGTDDQRFAVAIAAGACIDPGFVPRLLPTLTTEYRRLTLVDAEVGSRITVDVALRSRLADGRSVGLPDRAIVETKSPGRPGEVDRLLWRSGHRPLRLSKYATTLAAARPDLPANRWHRTISLAGFQPLT